MSAAVLGMLLSTEILVGSPSSRRACGLVLFLGGSQSGIRVSASGL
jgi:hypothetical protein